MDLLYTTILASIFWDLLSFVIWKHKDYTVSGFVFRTSRRFPIIPFAVGMLAEHYLPTTLPVIVVYILAGHLFSKN